MVKKEVTKQHILQAIKEIDRIGVPKRRQATKYNLYHDGKSYPPKYVLSVATKYVTGRELEARDFNGGNETNNFLSSLGFTIREGSNEIKKVKSKKLKICTTLFQISTPFRKWDTAENEIKFHMLEILIGHIPKDINILLLPAGFLNSKKDKAASIFKQAETRIRKLIRKYNHQIYVCLGVDGLNKKEQCAVAINETGIVAVARKFYHIDDTVSLATSPFEKENGKERFFNIADKKAYLAVCYDVFGISHSKLNKPDFDFVLNVVHGFDNSGGDSDFARKGLAGAAKKWDLNVYASAVFADNRNAANWTSGVRWTHGKNSVKDYKYDVIRIEPKGDTYKTDFATIFIRHYDQ